MDSKEPAYFDLETVALLREVLDDAWALLRPEQRATMLKTTLAERILASAAQGERDRERLLDAALRELKLELATPLRCKTNPAHIVVGLRVTEKQRNFET